MPKSEDCGISRLIAKMREHDTGFIAVYGAEDSHTDNPHQRRNGELLSNLTAKGYRVTSVRGSYIQDFSTPEAKLVRRRTFFVEDYQDHGTLKADLMELGTRFDHDSVWFIPRPDTGGETNAVLIGTNPATFPGRGNEIAYSTRTFSCSAEFMREIGSGPFTFECVEKEHDTVGSFFGRWARKVILDRQRYNS